MEEEYFWLKDELQKVKYRNMERKKQPPTQEDEEIKSDRLKLKRLLENERYVN
jgi:hypothetical protein